MTNYTLKYLYSVITGRQQYNFEGRSKNCEGNRAHQNFNL